MLHPSRIFSVILSLCLAMTLATNPSFGGEKKSKCGEKKAAAAKVTVAKVDGKQKESGKSKSAKPPQPVPDPVPQSIDAQVQSLAQGLSDLPPDPKPGECYVRVKQAAKYETVREKVLVQPETVRYEIKPAQFKDVEQTVVIRPESVRYEIVPEKWENKTVEVVLTPAHETLTATKTKFKAETAQYQTLPERVFWKRGVAPLSAQTSMTEDILCLVREEAEFLEYEKKLVAKPAKLNTLKNESKTTTVKTRVLVRPAKVKEIKVPAETKTIQVRELVRPAESKEVKVPAVYKDVERKVLVAQERMVWQRVLCDTNVTKPVIEQIQTRLKKAGFDPGAKDGKLSKATCDAVKRYQKANQLAEGAITYEFLDHIGVKP